MLQPTRSFSHRNSLATCLLALLLALLMIVAAPAVVSAQGANGDANDAGDQGPPAGPPDNIGDPGGPNTPPDGPGDPGDGPGGDPTATDDNDMDGDMGGGMAAPIPKSNRIVYHAATPVQLVKTGDDGLHLYFIGADGSTYTGPVFSSFAMLEEMHPSGAAVSLYDGKNPSTGQPVTIDYLPDENRIFVKTFYPAGHDKYNPNKAYDFTVDDKYKVKHVNW